MKRYLCGFLIACLMLLGPYSIIAEDLEMDSEESSLDVITENGFAENPEETADEVFSDYEENPESPDDAEPEYSEEEISEDESSNEDNEIPDENGHEDSAEYNSAPNENPDENTANEDCNECAEENNEDQDENTYEDPNEDQAESPSEDIPAPTIAPSIAINEIMIGSEINPQKDVWIEFYNTTDLEIKLAGWQIKGVTSGGKWIDIVNDPDLAISPDGYFLLSYYSNSSYSALDVKPQMTKSSLSFPNASISIEIKDPEGDIIDIAVFEHENNSTYRAYERDCLYSDGGLAENWLRSSSQKNLKKGLLNTFATPNRANSICEDKYSDEVSDEDAQNTNSAETVQPPQINESPAPKAYPYYRLINEFMPDPVGKDEGAEWIELFNGTSGSINLSGWYLDDTEGSSSPYKIKENTYLIAGEYLVIGGPELKLSLKNTDDHVRLLDPNKEAKEVISYSGAKEGWSYAKKPDGTSEWTPLSTPGQANRFPLPPKEYRPDDIVFRNVLPNPEGADDGKEVITIKNNLNETVDMTGWKIVNQKNKEFGIYGIIIAPFRQHTFNPADFKLTLVNKEDQLSLMDPAGNLIDRINWIDAKNNQIIYKPDYFRDGLKAKVIRIIDGDTFVSLIDGDEFTIRLIGVDTPETVHPKKAIEKYGIEASDYLKKLLSDKTVTLDFDETKIDIYGRLLAYAYTGMDFVNAEILKNGYGYAYTRFPFKYKDDFIKYELDAKNRKIGIWSNAEIMKLIEDTKDEPDEDEKNNSDPLHEEKDDAPATKIPQCPTEGLMINAILPNEEKGVSVEFIRIINKSDETVCLHGWALDDEIGKGSKPFTIKSGAIAPGGTRTFRKSETKIILNDSNDCASLINPLGELVDQICYTKTRKSEIFTHEGGNWVAKPKAPSKPKKTTSTKKQSLPTRGVDSYKWELKNETIEGKISFIYEDGAVMFLETAEKIVPVSYANSKVNINSAKQMLDFGAPVKLDVRSSGEERELVSISQDAEDNKTENKPSPVSGKLPPEIKYIIGIIFILCGLYLFKRFSHKIMP